MLMKKTNALRWLDLHNINYSTISYQYNSNDLNVLHIAKQNNLDASTLYKTLALQGTHAICLAVINAQERLSLKKIASLMQQKKVEMIPAAHLLNKIGYQRGACSPVGIKKTCKVYISAEAKKLESICVNAGKRGLLMQIKVADLLRACSGQWADICL